MAKKRNNYVETRWNKQDNMWIVAHEGQGIGTWAKKAEAVLAGRDVARDKQLEHVVKNKNGKIAYRNSYGNDPRSRKG